MNACFRRSAAAKLNYTATILETTEIIKPNHKKKTIPNMEYDQIKQICNSAFKK